MAVFLCLAPCAFAERAEVQAAFTPADNIASMMSTLLWAAPGMAVTNTRAPARRSAAR